MKSNFRIRIDPHTIFSLISHKNKAYIDIYQLYSHNQVSLRFDDPVKLGLLHRAIGYLLEDLQPGTVFPLPEGDAEEVDAMKIIYEIDRLWSIL